ncbi:putative damage-inducible protein DinB [Tenacibaculum adriaticum]|uniref:Putative damage-inducible protein DinB n=1 Tax=Tenacibaculum adriaticum TaxID=413713 RepID=A0A5S5DW51_9FLAO|nr:DinB family protein [Tenacibaculum adriaticum]TYQ00178.1 putative damage-inducible protein DinB [Tenacibaculum adriaticum]
MTKKYFTEQAKYNNWADSFAIEWLTQINDEQWEQLIISSFSSVRKTAIHLTSAKRIWIDFWTKVPNPVYLSAEFNGTKNDLIEIWKKTSINLLNFIESYPEEDYLKPVDFVYPNGKKDQMIFWQTFPHFVNHATYHRGQLVTLLRQVGFTDFSNTDLATYFIKKQNTIA